ncbi:MAG: hypothetical protein KVP17_001650 [Porospora cf. gigantea B]|uniref:uncharacterized protein n=1 Tax=Porospora cf. gigantea B TaxID=2853592 RepID=UPI003571DBFE|nr:MAG: hypothetical protein KVP17_001650 [Porospora cf. gigantea B]
MFAQYVAESLEDEPVFPFAIRTPQVNLLALNLRDTYVEGLNDLLLSFSDRTGLQVALVALRSDTTTPTFGPLTESEDLHFLDMIRPMPAGYNNAVVAGSDCTICPLLEASVSGYRTLLDEERLDAIPPELVVAAGSAIFLLDVDVSIYVLSPGLYFCAARSEDLPPRVMQLQPDTRFHERVADVMDDFYFLPDPENIIGECQSLYYPLNCKTLVSLLNEETNVPDFRSCDGPQVLALCDWKCSVQLEIGNSLPCPPETSNCLLGVKIGSLKDCSLPVWALELDFLQSLAAENEGQSYEFVTDLGPYVWTSEGGSGADP